MTGSINGQALVRVDNRRAQRIHSSDDRRAAKYQKPTFLLGTKSDSSQKAA